MRYDYECKECGTIFEVEKAMKDPPPSACIKCKSPKVERHFGSADSPPVIYAGRPIWTYNDSKKYKQCSQNGGRARKIDPSKHGDMGSWHCPGEFVK